ncbi:hypothetical protein [Argonema antarcticum]|uniref:hypothetical protein n=1 Tax=Argonema antarcticum TaxID=2942763 RepID=UPI00201239A6|nr:hypothetical protein [Argonema antarcticum]
MNLQESTLAAWAKIQGMIDGLIVMLPNIMLAAIVFGLFFFGAGQIKLLVKRLTRRHRQARNLGLVLGRLSQGVVILVGLFIAENDRAEIAGAKSIAALHEEIAALRADIQALSGHKQES